MRNGGELCIIIKYNETINIISTTTKLIHDGLMCLCVEYKRLLVGGQRETFYESVVFEVLSAQTHFTRELSLLEYCSGMYLY